MLGALSSLFRKRWILGLFGLQLLLLILFLARIEYSRSSEGCVACHGDRARMEKLGYPQLFMTQKQVEKETRHSGVKCHECHLGNGRADTASRGHEGMLKGMYLDFDADIIDRKELAGASLKPLPGDRLRSMLPIDLDESGQLTLESSVRNVLYHDRNPETLGYDPDIGRKACGKSGCHPEEVEQFSHTVMGANIRQRKMESWIKPYGPQNCGPSFADTPGSGEAVGDRFSFGNQQQILKEMNVEFSREQAIAKQKYCNVCHAGCLDCHFTPFKGEGAHGFSKKPPSESCTGGGRGSSMCHSGSMERRRGDSYLGGDFSEPPDMEPDVHVKEDIHCVDCHITGPGGMGDIQRKAVCSDCHLEAEYSLAESVHRNVDCAACHVSGISGYQLTHWGPGEVAGEPSPFKKYSLYYGTFSPPIIMKDQTGLWIPVKAWPHSVANFGPEVPPKKGIEFRWPGGETRDSYSMLGTMDNLPANNRHMAWVEIEQVAHPFGKSRECDSCHVEPQRAESEWDFLDEGAETFSGGYSVTAGREGMHIFDIHTDEPVEVEDGARLIDFAPWMYLGDIWRVDWDFSIPGKDYDEELELYRRGVKTLDEAKKSIGEKRYRRLREVMVHNPEMGLKESGVESKD